MAGDALTNFVVVQTVVDIPPEGSSALASWTIVLEATKPDGSKVALPVTSSSADFPTTNAEWDTWWTTVAQPAFTLLGFDAGGTPPYELYQEA